MKLRIKLILLVTGAAALFLLSVAVYFVLLIPLDSMQREASTFQAFGRAAANLETQAGFLLARPFGSQIAAWQDAQKAFQAAQAAVAEVKTLRTNTELAAAVEAVANLGSLSQSAVEGIDKALADLRDEAKDVVVKFDGADWSQVSRASAEPDVKNGATLRYYLNNVTRLVGSLADTLDVTRSVVETKDGDIANELGRLRLMSTLGGIAGIGVTVALALVASLFLGRNITRPLLDLGRLMTEVGTGDLRRRSANRRRDEVGRLGQDFDAFLDTLTSAIRRIQEASAANQGVRDQLSAAAEASTASAHQIEANSKSILAQLERVDERIQASESDLNGVVVHLEAFRSRLAAQSQEVAGATEAVSSLAQGIGQVSDLSVENRRAVEGLLAQSEGGREVFDRSFAKVGEISESVETIQEMVGTIAEIAGQTNILALNAAIEAAHAGESGRGFAVVADEISKLAAASAESSSQIALTIRAVVAKILEAEATREETLAAFGAIGDHIAQVSERSQGIFAEIDHMNRETGHIRQTMGSLATSAQDTTEEAERIGTVATRLGDALGQVGRISHEVVSNIGEITAGLGEISRTAAEVQTQATRLEQVGSDLDEAVHTFVIDTPPQEQENTENPLA